MEMSDDSSISDSPTAGPSRGALSEPEPEPETAPARTRKRRRKSASKSAARLEPAPPAADPNTIPIGPKHTAVLLDIGRRRCHLDGALIVHCLRGCVTLNGFRMASGASPVTVWSAKDTGLMLLALDRAAASVAPSVENCPPSMHLQALAAFDGRKGAVVLLEEQPGSKAGSRIACDELSATAGIHISKQIDTFVSKAVEASSKPGLSVAVVGGKNSGKSTLVRLLVNRMLQTHDKVSQTAHPPVCSV